MKKNVKYILFQFLVIIISVEFILRITGKFTTYSEKIGSGYASYYGQVLPTWYHHWKPSSSICYGRTEFNYCYDYNSLGLRDKEWISEIPDSTKRIIILGDSFTEGDGAFDKENFPSFFEKTLNEESKEWEVYNGGVCGSDPFYNLIFFNTIVVPKYEYDVLMLLVNNSDISDFIYRSGMERFHEDSTTHNRKPPWFEPLYHYSHFARAVFKQSGYTDELISKRMKQQYQSEAITRIAEVYQKINNVSKKNNKKVLIVIHTTPGIVNTKEAAIDYINNLEPILKSEGIPCINICNEMENVFSKLEYEKYAWKKNVHFNSFGYKLFSDIIFDEANTKYPDLLK